MTAEVIELDRWRVGDRRALRQAMPLFKAACQAADAAAGNDRVAMARALAACRVAIAAFDMLIDMRHGLWKRLSAERRTVAAEANGYFWRAWLLRGGIERRLRAMPTRIKRTALPRVSRRMLGGALANDRQAA